MNRNDLETMIRELETQGPRSNPDAEDSRLEELAERREQLTSGDYDDPDRFSVFQCWEPGEGDGVGRAETLEGAHALIAKAREEAGPDSQYGYEIFDWQVGAVIWEEFPEPDNSGAISRAERAWDTYAYGN